MKVQIDVEGIVGEYLKSIGAEGLAGTDCSCELSDLMPCGEPNINDCVAGIKIPCNGNCESPNHCDWHIKPIEVVLASAASAEGSEVR
jgi:hypothetical protein